MLAAIVRNGQSELALRVGLAAGRFLHALRQFQQDNIVSTRWLLGCFIGNGTSEVSRDGRCCKSQQYSAQPDNAEKD